MIPKVIHYCWFGGAELPPLAKRCIASWRKFLPDYEIVEWNEKNFDVNQILYTRQAYAAKKYAFVSDYARFKILYDQGGLYFDTDVEVIRPLDDIIANGPFMGCETDADPSTGTPMTVAPGLGLGARVGEPLYMEILDYYDKLSFIGSDGQHNLLTVVDYTTDLLRRHGLKDVPGIQSCFDILIYPKEYFCPYYHTIVRPTPNSRTIHWYAGTWLSPRRRLFTRAVNLCYRLLGVQGGKLVNKSLRSLGLLK